MKFSYLKILIVIILSTIMAPSCEEGGKAPHVKAPEAKKISKELNVHGVTRVDNYYWMNERDHPDVVAYLEEENVYTHAMLRHTGDLQEKLFAEITGRIKPTDMSVPYFLNGYYYYTRYEEGKEYPVHCRKNGALDAEEEVMLDVNAIAQGFSFFHVGSLQVSEDNTLLSYSVDTLSRRIYTIHFKNLQTGEVYPESIPETSGNMAWAGDNATLFYSVKDETLRPYRVYRHRFGEDSQNDILVYEEQDPTFNLWVTKTKSREYLVIQSSSTLSDECRILRADRPEGEFSVFQPRQRGVEYSIAHAGDRFYILTNLDAQNFRLMETGPEHTEVVHWKELIAHRKDVLLEDFEVFENFLALNERSDALTRLRIIHPSGEDYYIEFQEDAFVSGFENNPEFKTDLLRYTYSSLTTPLTVFDYNTANKSRTMLKQQEVLGGYEPARYKTERLWAPAANGVQVPLTMVYRKDLKKDTGNPLLLYGYGSYGASMDPYFSAVRLSLLDRGFIFAIAHIRGGEEMGRMWYEEGKLLNKMNTFTDFISCGEYLLEHGYAAPGKLYAMGGSAGGLLIGTVINLRPGLFDAAIAAVPFVDVVTTMLDESIPLTTSEYDEWGNPGTFEHFNYMLSYSPYDNVKAQDYPALLVTAGYHDSQVQYWEPAKWVAKLRVHNTGDRPLLLWTNMEYGHGGASGRFERYRETAMEYAFLLDLAGITE